MFQILCIVFLIGAPLFVLITYLLTMKGGSSTSSFAQKDLPLADEEVYRTIPPEFLQHLRFSVRYSSVQKRFGSGQTYVYLEEQLRYGNVPLTDWIKHDVPIEHGFEPSPQVLRTMSLLKQYDARKAVPMARRLDGIAGGGR
jgi:hypothetical protein